MSVRARATPKAASNESDPQLGQTHPPNAPPTNANLRPKETAVKFPSCLFAVAFLAGAVVAAMAAEQSVSQKGKVFSVTDVTVKKGDTLLFVNDDNVAHTIYSTSPGNEFDLGAQAPGTSIPVTFDKSGDIAIMCAIHPLMKMKVKVTE
jgi:plastocyanin